MSASITVLDYGCGAGQIVTALRNKGIDARGCDVFYTGGDYSSRVQPELLGGVIKHMEHGVIPFPDESFDYVVNNQVMEHVEDIDSVLTEIYRVLKPGGQVLSMFPDKSCCREGHCGIPFLHWFPKSSKGRIYYAAFLRALGMGYFKGDKSILQWSRDFCQWLDRWTWYRSYREICTVFDKRFVRLTHIEEQWLQIRYGRWAMIIGWLPRQIRRWVLRKLAGMVFISIKAI
ncbi:MAG: class I SAM-dependent methyltransferase [Candidatus Kuenenia stuttgartiensis]|nr:class I SAM-dependent methyltransferase [Candidatus Kuenenia stuttgartiensis]MBZ0190650.1 class I SAM-dependent methyltransferase [Candidatus Kuenenia stuttgartiensis]